MPLTQNSSVVNMDANAQASSRQTYARNLSRLLRILRGFSDRIIDLVYPRDCSLCGIPLGTGSVGAYICWECRGRIDLQDSKTYCDRCGRSAAGARPQAAYACSRCERHPPYFHSARSAAHFSDPVRTLLLDFKYHKAIWLCRDLADLLEACVRSHYRPSDYEAVVPVPLHTKRRRERGYNQSDLLAIELARRLKTPCFTDALIRTRDTGTQTLLDAGQRRSNMAGAFRMSDRCGDLLAERKVLLVDDVMTTGATVGEAARALLKGRVREVRVATVARD